MSNTITVTKLVDNQVFVQAVVNILGDGSGEETDTVILDASALTPAAAKLRIMKIEGTLAAFTAVIEADGSTDVIMARLPADYFVFNFEPQGFATSRATAPTGDVTITTSSLGSGDAGTFTIWAKKIAA